MLTRCMKDALDFLDAYRATEGRSPTLEEVRAGLGLAHKSGAHRVIASLASRGFVSRDRYTERSALVLRVPGRDTVLKFNDSTKRLEPLDETMTAPTPAAKRTVT